MFALTGHSLCGVDIYIDGTRLPHAAKTETSVKDS
jgi:hypothetical protein